MIRYYIKNVNTNCYVVDEEDYIFYKLDVSKATKFTEKQAEKRLSKMKHPENWDIVKVEVK